MTALSTQVVVLRCQLLPILPSSNQKWKIFDSECEKGFARNAGDREAFQEQSSIGKMIIRVIILIMQRTTASNGYKDEAFSFHTIHLPRFHFPKATCPGWAMLCGATSHVRSSVNSYKSPRQQDPSNLKLYKVPCYSFWRCFSSLILQHLLHWLLQKTLKHLCSLTKQGLDHLGEVTPNDTTQFREK